MKEYNYKDIKEINDKGIVLKNGYIIFFEECRKEWAKEKGIEIKETHCVAERNYDKAYFLFYTKERVKIYFEVRILFKRRRALRIFVRTQLLLNRYGYSSYDLS